MATSPILKNPDVEDSYEQLYDLLGKAYWETADIHSKDLIHGAQEAVGDILTAFDEQDLADNTALFTQLKPKIDATNEALEKIKKQISDITKNINTASQVVAAISKVLSLFPV